MNSGSRTVAAENPKSVAAGMRLAGGDAQPLAEELDLLQQHLPLAGARILELGCGGAEKTLRLHELAPDADILAAEVDPVAHERNLARSPVAGIRFERFGAEAIPLPDASVDIVLMFKSLHHVPVPAMDRALAEIARVLVPGGQAWISEPVFAGAFNDIMRLFHDEQAVRAAAFEAMQRAVGSGLLELSQELFFLNELRFESFAQYERGVLQVTHSDFKLTPEILAEVRRRFEAHGSAAGYRFDIPNRVDLLRKS